MSILNMAYSSMNAFQSALTVTGNNLSNMYTRGYARQSMQFNAGTSSQVGGVFVGSGVTVGSVFRNVDQFANSRVRGTTSTLTQFDTFYQKGLEIDKLLSQEGSSISKTLQSFFGALDKANATPDSAAARNVAFMEATNMVSQFNAMQSRLDDFQTNSTAQMSEIATQINQKTEFIAELNSKIMNNGDAPELLTQRDVILEELSELVDISVVDQSNGTVTVSLTSGEMLVAGSEKRNMSISTGKLNDAGSKVYLVNQSGQVDVTSKIHAGKLGGLLDYQTHVIGHTSQLIGQMAIGMAQKFNAQQVLGMDMNNQIGKNIFNDFNSTTRQLDRAIAETSNTGTAVFSVAISDISQTKLSDYDLVVSNAATNEIRLIRKSDGTSTTMTLSSGPPAPPGGQVVFDGMTIQVDDLSKLSDTDRYTLLPTKGAARNLSLDINSGLEIAMAAPVKVQAPLSNMGNGTIALGTVFDTTSVNKEFRIDFISDTQYNLVNVTDSTSSGPFAFTPGSDNTIQIPDSLSPSYSVVISGAPKTGDQFSTSYNAGGYADNRNGSMMASIQQSKFFNSGSESLFDRYAGLLSEVGSQVNQAKNGLTTATVLYQQAFNDQQSVSGVDINEEISNMMKLKQAYEAAGKLVQVSSEMMRVLFDVLR